MSNIEQAVLDEVTSESLTRDHVERRVKDWVKRLDELYDLVKSALPPGWTAEVGRSVPLSEPLMRKFEVEDRELPTLTLLYDHKPKGFIEPRGLWIIGANGRVDLHIGPEHYLIFDGARNFAPAEWTIARLQDRRNREPFDQKKLQTILNHAPVAGN